MTRAEQRAERDVLMVKYEQSEMNGRMFAEAHGIKPHTFYRWVRQVREGKERTGGRFVEVRRSEDASGGRCCFEIGGVSVHVSELPPAAWVGEVLRTART